MPTLRRGMILIVTSMFFVVGCSKAESDSTLDQPTAPPTETPGAAADLSNETVVDIDGNIYPIVQIGEQWWMAENLRVTSDPAGIPITSYCYNEVETNCEIYGRLYTWKTAMNRSTREGAAGICPTGWHIPSDSEWLELIDTLGGESVAGGKLKEEGLGHWISPNRGATDEVGFNALPTGWFDFTGEYYGIGEICFYRTSSAESPYDVYARELDSSSIDITRGGLHPDDAIPIRCVRD
jgi:uncharacterized protein (TIGR02145 family)